MSGSGPIRTISTFEDGGRSGVYDGHRMERRRYKSETGFAILVEGKNDRARLRKLVPEDVLILCTNGIPSHEKLMALRKQVGNRQPVILTDNDASGRRIRRLLADVFPDATHAYTKAGYAGVEGTPLEYLEKQLERVGVLKEQEEDPPVRAPEPAGVRERIRGGLLGLAVGNAVGAAAKCLTPLQIRERYGVIRDMVGGGPSGLRAGETTGVATLAAAVAEGILASPGDPVREIGRRIVSWLETDPADAERTVRTAVDAYHRTGDWFAAAEWADRKLGGQSGENGSLTRVLPVALAYYPDRAAVDHWARIQSRMTHFHPAAAEACALYSQIACDGLAGWSLQDSIRRRVRGTPYEIVLRPVDFLALETVPDRNVVNSLRWTLHALLTSHSFEQAVTTAVNWGYEADATGALVGGLAGVFYGARAIPGRWLSALGIREGFERLSDRMAGFARTGRARFARGV